MRKYYLILLLFRVICANGQSGGLRFKHLGLAEGLSQSSVYCLFQDSRGFVWVGTTDGLSRYDGYEFRHYKYDQDDPHSLGSNELLSLCEDSSGNLLVATAAGVDLLDVRKEKFEHLFRTGDKEHRPLGFVNYLYKDSRGTIWAGGSIGLMRYEWRGRCLTPIGLPQRGSLTWVKGISEDSRHRLWVGQNEALICWDPVAGRELPLPQEIANNPWYKKSRIAMIRHDSAGNMWIGTERDGLLVITEDGKRCLDFHSGVKPGSISNDMIRAISFYKGQTWIGSRDGVYLIDRTYVVQKHLTTDKYDPASLSGNSVLCFMEDNAHSLWIGTFSGAISIDQPGNDNFSYIREQLGGKSGLNCKVVSCIREGDDHSLWIGTEGGGLNRFDRGRGTFQYIPVGIGSDHVANQQIVKTLESDVDGNLWVGTLEGLFYYNRKTGRLKEYDLAETPDKLLDLQIYGLAKDSAGLWIGTKGGLFHMDRKFALTRYRHIAGDRESLISSQINTLMRDSHDNIWVGTEKGLSFLPRGATRFINYPEHEERVFNGNAIICLFEDKSGNTWIGTRGGGIIVFDSARKRHFIVNSDGGLADNIVHAITQDRQGDLWVSYSQGIARIRLNGKDFPMDRTDVQVTNYSVNNGLGSNEFLAANCRTASGEILFGGVNGIVSFSPELLVANAVPPPVVLTDLLIKNVPALIDTGDSPLHESIAYTDAITLTHEQDYFSIRFAALNYINPGTNQYAYLMEGLKSDKKWYYVGAQQSATYTNLDAGEYVFKVRAANNDGRWNENYTSLRIRVLPPLWKTWWAYLIYAMIICGLLYLFYSFSIKTDRLRSDLQLQRISREKDQELVQKQLSFFTNISHEIKTPLTLILAPLEKLSRLLNGNVRALDQLQYMQRNGERLLRLTNQLLDFRKLEAGSLQLMVAPHDLKDFVAGILHSFEAYARHCDVALQFSGVGPGERVWLDGDKVEKMLYNLLSNAFKFISPGGYVRVSAKLERSSGEEPGGSGQRNVVILVEDNGSGIAANHLENIFYPFHHYNDTGVRKDGTGIGLAFTKGLVAVHHGKISVTSRQATGELSSAQDATERREGYTCFTIILPADREAYPAEETVLQTEAVAGTSELMGPPIASGQDVPVVQGGGLDIQSGSGPEASITGALIAGKEARPLMLIVEDNEEVLSFMAAHFEELYTVHRAGSGTEGWDLATTLIPDIIISDVMMPGISGIELCQRLKQDIRTSHIPVILLTARTPLVFQLEGYECGADDYVTKPFSLALLQVRVNNLIVSRRMLRERYRQHLVSDEPTDAGAASQAPPSPEPKAGPAHPVLSPADELFLGRIVQFVEDNLMEPTLNVEVLGRTVGMSRVTLYRKVKALTDLSPIEFMRSVRLKKAAGLLRRKEYTVNEVAYMVGFSDVDYFRKWFKQEFGNTPSEYASGEKS